MFRLLLLYAIVVTVATFNVQASIGFDHQNWNHVLDQYVDERGFVDYHALAANRGQFDLYIESIQQNGPNTSPELFPSLEDRLAYYINAYNALVFEGVLNRGPEEKSVWRGLISGLNFFVLMKVGLDNQQTNLKKLEDDILRKQFKDPRIHAAIVCASISCPRLQQTAFKADRLDMQLDAAMREFVAHPRNVRVDHTARKIYLSKIFDWFEEDFIEFEKAQGNNQPTLISYINRYRAKDLQLPAGYQIQFIKYNKAINKQT